MKVAVLGTGMVGQSLADRLAGQGHDVTVGTRDVEATMARTAAGSMGNPPMVEWLRDHPRVTLATFATATAASELIVNATSGDASVAVLEAAGRENLAGKVLLDFANPLDYSQGFPPSLFVSNTDSLAEQIQAAFPEARVVKSLNTMNALLMVDPRQLADADHTVFVSGNDVEAKQVVTGLLRSFGHTDVIDLGDLSTARGTESLLPVWVRLFGVLGMPTFQFKIVR
ncbi:NAD(P)-binding domain-containing protein [Microbacterium sp. MF43]|uniref:NADPH-dependent F420 reductase n=1 Tax=Microbacterium TaxID=33882 RepID=UPI00146E2301|nr:NAD(P)-binding domain-containing protein [Microbacterium sp. MF43]